ncbi:hypothetical protein P691DRAFT_619970, partial [Macrolepiota fuliginosa MF-IS2]
VPKNPQYHSPHIPLDETMTAIEKLGRSFLLASFVFGPRILPIPTCICMLKIVVLPP